ncbi:MAG: adenylate/guanylate cyclase domain-containing protein, partial [Burkholderiales bacterium]
MTSFAHWLTEIGLESYASVFAQNEVDFDVLASVTEADLQALGLPLGARKRLLQAIAKLDGQGAAQLASLPTASAAIPPPAPFATLESPAGERRQLTVMFCDLVGSTALSEKLDPEELRSLLHDYRTRCGEVISRYEGFVARYVGDGILTYFGWPTAHEDDAERALRAALEIVQAVKRASSTEALSVRIS